MFLALSQDIESHFPVFSYHKTQVDSFREDNEDTTYDHLEQIEGWIEKGSDFDDFKDFIQD